MAYKPGFIENYACIYFSILLPLSLIHILQGKALPHKKQQIRAQKNTTPVFVIFVFSEEEFIGQRLLFIITYFVCPVFCRKGRDSHSFIPYFLSADFASRFLSAAAVFSAAAIFL